MKQIILEATFLMEGILQGIDSYSFFTGSFLKVLAQEASVTLFGTEIQMDRATWLVPTLNQSLTSEAISEPQGSSDRHLDQFDLSNNSLFKGSYVEHVLTGHKWYKVVL